MLKKFSDPVRCMCDQLVEFEIIDEIECDWGSHVVIQCPNCEELFSVDKRCPAFGDVLDLDDKNTGLFSDKEKFDYQKDSHPL